MSNSRREVGGPGVQAPSIHSLLGSSGYVWPGPAPAAKQPPVSRVLLGVWELALLSACLLSLSLTPRCLLPPLELELLFSHPGLCMTSTHRLSHPLPSPILPFTHAPCPVPVVGKEAGTDSVPLCVVLFPLNTLEEEHLAWGSGVGCCQWRNA